MSETLAPTFSQSEMRERQKVHALANRRTEIIVLRHQESKSHMSHACCIANQRREGHMIDVAANKKIEKEIHTCIQTQQRDTMLHAVFNLFTLAI